MGWWVFMLEIKKIHKVYTTDNFKQTALDNVSLNFRESEFVSMFPPENAGDIADILSIDTHFDNFILGAGQLIEFIKNSIEKIEIGSDILKAKTYLEHKKSNRNGHQ